MNQKPAKVDTKQKLEQLVHRLNEHQRRVRLVEAGEAPAPGSQAPAPVNKGTPAPTPAPMSKSQAPEQSQAPTDDVTVDTITQQLNAIRGGKSFKDTLVQQELSRYIDGLEESEQQALHAYLKGIAQIVSGQVEAGQAEEPSNHGVETKETGKKARQIKPNVVKKAPPPKPAAVAGAPTSPPKEDTTPPAAGPIVPKKR